MASVIRSRQVILVAFAATLSFGLFFVFLSPVTRPYVNPKNLLKGFASAGANNSTDSQERVKLFFEEDLPEYRMPKFDVEKLSLNAAHNYKGPGHPAYATLYATRDATLQDPLFIAAQQVVFRILWQQDRRSEKYPVVVFVLPFVPQLHRKYFRAAGAIVREIGLHDVGEDIYVPRYRDQFSKLNMWRHTDFSKLLYTDADALSWTNMDTIFDNPEPQRCKTELMTPEEARTAASICDYTFAAWVNDQDDELNAGVVLLQPNYQMYERLVRGFLKLNSISDDYEQRYLNTSFSATGAFPRRRLSNEWNGGHEKGSHFYITHAKPWVMNFGDAVWLNQDWNDTWSDMLSLYESSKFLELRAEDQRLALQPRS